MSGSADCAAHFLWKGVCDVPGLGVERAREYLFQMRSAIGVKLITPGGLYGGREGHLRLARECGFALNDFDAAGQKEIMTASYGTVYVTGCRLKPLLSAKEWRAGLITGKKGKDADEVDE